MPNPYSTHEPTLGRTSREPVFIMIVATSCAGMSVYIERTTHRSSTSSPNCGKTSLTSMPDLPLGRELERRPHGHAVHAGQRLAVVFASATAWDPRCPRATARPGRKCARRVWPWPETAESWAAVSPRLPWRRPPAQTVHCQTRSPGSTRQNPCPRVVETAAASETGPPAGGNVPLYICRLDS